MAIYDCTRVCAYIEPSICDGAMACAPIRCVYILWRDCMRRYYVCTLLSVAHVKSVGRRAATDVSVINQGDLALFSDVNKSDNGTRIVSEHSGGSC